MFLVLRSYGGLGNQIFQYFFCFNIQEKIKFKEIYSIHNTNYLDHTIHNESLKIYPKPPKLIKIISNLRLPMVLSKLGVSKKGYRWYELLGRPQGELKRSRSFDRSEQRYIYIYVYLSEISRKSLDQ